MSESDLPNTSATLLALLRQPGNEQAWRRFVVIYRPLIIGACRHAGLQANDIDELTGRVLAKLVTALASFQYDPARSFRGYLRTIVANELAECWRELIRRPGSLGSGDSGVLDALAQTPAPFVELADDLDQRVQDDLSRAQSAIQRAKSLVSDVHWQAFWMTAVESLTAIEAAAKLQLTVAAVYMAKSRVGKILREQAA